MTYENIIYEQEGGIARIKLNRPAKLNALSKDLLNEFFDALEKDKEDKSTSVLIVSGEGRAFSAGYDISTPPLSDSINEDRKWQKWRADRWLKLWEHPKPTIAKIHGYCLAGGNELAGNCDLIVAAKDARIGHPGARSIGLLPNTLAIWPVMIGPRKTKELMFTGRHITGEEAERIGMINQAVPEDQLDEVVNDLALTIAKMPLPLLTIHKDAINSSWELTQQIHIQIRRAIDHNALFHATPESKEFYKIVGNRGLKEALDWRDTPFGDYHGAKKPGE